MLLYNLTGGHLEIPTHERIAGWLFLPGGHRVDDERWQIQREHPRVLDLIKAGLIKEMPEPKPEQKKKAKPKDD
jgi:hypothetical protein